MYKDGTGLNKYTDVAQAVCPVQETMRQRLHRKQTYLSQQLGEVTDALYLLDANPGFEALQDAISRAL